MVKTYTTIFAMAALFVTLGCSHTSADSSSKPAAESPAKGPQYHVSYIIWRGVSPRDDFTFTSLRAAELDLDDGLIRRIHKSARDPDPMLPFSQIEVDRILASIPWTRLRDKDAAILRHLLHAWLKTDPPAVYNKPIGLRYEDRYVETLTVSWNGQSRSTTIYPRAGHLPDEQGPPPPEWTALLEAILGSKPGELKKVE